MKVRTLVETTQEVEVDVSLDDVMAEIAALENPASSQEAIRILNLCISAVMKVEKVRLHPAIATGDLDALLKDLLNLSDKAVIIIVGHEPHMGIWVTRITEAEVPFSLASLAAVKMTSLDPPAGRLRWFASSGLLADIAEENG